GADVHARPRRVGHVVGGHRGVFRAPDHDFHGRGAADGPGGGGVVEVVHDDLAGGQALQPRGGGVGETAGGVDLDGRAPGADGVGGGDLHAGADVVGEHAGRGYGQRGVLGRLVEVGDGGANRDDRGVQRQALVHGGASVGVDGVARGGDAGRRR